MTPTELWENRLLNHQVKIIYVYPGPNNESLILEVGGVLFSVTEDWVLLEEKTTALLWALGRRSIIGIIEVQKV